MSVNSNFKVTYKNKVVNVDQGENSDNETFERVALTSATSVLKNVCLAGFLIPAKPSVLLNTLRDSQYFKYIKKNGSGITYYSFPSIQEFTFESFLNTFQPNQILNMKSTTKFVDFVTSINTLINQSYYVGIKLEERTVFYIDNIVTDLFPNLCNNNGSFSGFLILLNQFDINNIKSTGPISINLDVSWNENLSSDHYFDFKDKDGNIAQNQGWNMFQIKHGNYSRDISSTLTLGDVIEVSEQYTINPNQITSVNLTDVNPKIYRRTITISNSGNFNV